MAVRIKWNMKAFEEIRRLPGVDRDLQHEVSLVMTRLGVYDGGSSDYAGGVEPGKSRSRGYVVTTSPKAMRREAHTNDLLRALAEGGQ